MLALLDLSMPGLNVADAVARLRDAVGPEAAILAFGPHVHAAKLAAATKAGCDRVLTRGQFSRDMASVLAEFLAPDGA
jgi:CheY-like chemotaxis protein